MIWPELRRRAGVDDALTDRMTDQHERVGRVLDQVDEELRRWAHDAGPISRKQRRLIMLGRTLEDADSR